MAVVRGLCAAISVGGLLLWAAPGGAQVTTGSVSGRVVDSTSQQPLANVTVSVGAGAAARGTLSRSDGSYIITGVPAGTQRVRAARIGFRAREATVAVTGGSTATANFALSASATQLTEIVTVGYGTQRREAITGAVATVDPQQANVGVIPNATGLLTARVAGVNVTSNSGEPGGGAQIRIRGGTSITASNDPLYVIDGVPIQNEQSVATGLGIGGGGAALARNPLNALNPNDIASLTVLKDASATAIYGSRGANGVVLIETKKGRAGASEIVYDTYVGAATAANRLDFASASQFRSFVTQQISSGGLDTTARSLLGASDTDWQDALLRTGITQNHDVSFSGGSQTTQYRAALNYFDQKGVVIANGLQRFQGRINANNQLLNGKLTTGLNLTASRVNNQFLAMENTGGFTGGVFTNMAIFNPTRPIRTATGQYFEIGTGGQDVRNPVAVAEQIRDRAPENRVLGNVTAAYAILPSLRASTTLGVDFNSSVRQTYIPLASPIGAPVGAQARQAERTLQNVNFQGLLTFAPEISEKQDFEILGGYEFTEFNNRGFDTEARGFLTDAFTFNNLGAGNQLTSPLPNSYIQQSRLVSFFSRANYSYANKYFLTGVMRYDGSSRLAPGNQWSLFPAVSGSWRLSEEGFLKGGMFSNLALRAGWGRQGNQAVAPYGTQLLFRTDAGARYLVGGQVLTGFGATQVPNPDLKWETSTQTNVGIDYGFKDNRYTGSFEVYQKDTRDLLFQVDVAQPAVVRTRVENVGSLRNRGFEAAFDAQILQDAGRTLSSGLVFSVERNEVGNIGTRPFIQTASVSGQGQSGRLAQRLIPGQPVGTFWGARYLGLNAQGVQEFACSRTTAGCTNGRTTNPTGDDEGIIGNANPAFSLGLRSNATLRKFDVSWLWRAEVDRDVFNNTALVYQTTSNVTQGRNFLADALNDGTRFGEPAIYSSRWIEDASFLRLQNVTLGYTFNLPTRLGGGRQTRLYVSGDNLLVFTGYSGFDPEVFVRAGGDDVVGAASRGVDYLAYPRARTITTGARIQF